MKDEFANYAASGGFQRSASTNGACVTKGLRHNGSSDTLVFCPRNLSPAERIDTAASILAVAVMRFRHRKLNKNNVLKTTSKGE